MADSCGPHWCPDQRYQLITSPTRRPGSDESETSLSGSEATEVRRDPQESFPDQVISDQALTEFVFAGGG